MRLLICLLLLLALSVPALADDDWDGDKVMHGHRGKTKDGEAKGDKGKGKGKAKRGEPESQPLGMYFGNGDEFLESGAPQQDPPETDAAPTEDPANPVKPNDVSSSDDGFGVETGNGNEAPAPVGEEQRSAILGPQHKAPQFAPVNENQPEAATEPVETEQPAEEEHAASAPAADAEVTKLSDEFGSTDESASEEEPASLVDESVPAEEVATQASDDTAPETYSFTPGTNADAATTPEEVQEVVPEVESAESGADALASDDQAAPDNADAITAADDQQTGNADLHQDNTLTPESGLAHYSTYPQVEGKGKSKADKPKAGLNDQAEEDDQSSDDQPVKPKRKGGIKMYDPDTW